MKHSDIVRLEQALLTLGKQELELENNLTLLKARTRAAADRGDILAADELWSVYEDTRTRLTNILTEITAIESVLYRLRRK